MAAVVHLSSSALSSAVYVLVLLTDTPRAPGKRLPLEVLRLVVRRVADLLPGSWRMLLELIAPLEGRGRPRQMPC